MKKLRHNGILVLPKYKAVGYTILVKKKDDWIAIQLNDKQEEMAFAWSSKRETPYVKDPVYRMNFFKDFCKELDIPYTEEINFDQIIFQLNHLKWIKENMTKEKKKAGIEDRKKLREKRKKLFGIALVDGKEVEVSNYIAEPSCIFMGRGKHPFRGRWKEGPRKDEIILNLSPDAPRLSGWKKIVWKPKKMWVASWIDKLSGKRKYVWLADTWGKKQKREREKFKKAEELAKNIQDIEKHILANLNSGDLERKKIATACLLIFGLNLRVGDEKDKDEADTVGCLSLRPEHISFKSNDLVKFSFLGKDSVEWEKELVIHKKAIRNLKEFMEQGKSPFEGLNSKQVSKFLSEKLKGLTAKVFRTYRATEAAKLRMKTIFTRKISPEWEKKISFKRINLAAAQICNHKKAKSKNYEKILEKKKEQLSKAHLKMKEAADKAKDIRVVMERYSKAKLSLELYKELADWNLGTSLKSYINPEVMKGYLDKVSLKYEKAYSKTLLRKFSWCLNETVKKT